MRVRVRCMARLRRSGCFLLVLAALAGDLAAGAHVADQERISPEEVQAMLERIRERKQEDKHERDQKDTVTRAKHLEALSLAQQQADDGEKENKAAENAALQAQATKSVVDKLRASGKYETAAIIERIHQPDNVGSGELDPSAPSLGVAAMIDPRAAAEKAAPFSGLAVDTASERSDLRSGIFGKIETSNGPAMPAPSPQAAEGANLQAALSLIMKAASSLQAAPSLAQPALVGQQFVIPPPVVPRGLLQVTPSLTDQATGGQQAALPPLALQMLASLVAQQSGQVVAPQAGAQALGSQPLGQQKMSLDLGAQIAPPLSRRSAVAQPASAHPVNLANAPSLIGFTDDDQAAGTNGQSGTEVASPQLTQGASNQRSAVGETAAQNVASQQMTQPFSQQQMAAVVQMAAAQLLGGGRQVPMSPSLGQQGAVGENPAPQLVRPQVANPFMPQPMAAAAFTQQGPAVGQLPGNLQPLGLQMGQVGSSLPLRGDVGQRVRPSMSGYDALSDPMWFR
jgi:hypothetical protein